MDRSYFVSRLAICSGYGEIFDLVKRAVKEALNLHRAGLLLYLRDMPFNVGAYHRVGSNVIVLNRLLISVMSRLLGSRDEYNSFIFSLLLHEYLHSLGFLDEGEVRRLAYRVCREAFGEDHPTVKMTLEPPMPIIPENYIEVPLRDDEEIVKDFERTESPYIV